jgi:arylsulfatase A-like enzyme
MTLTEFFSRTVITPIILLISIALGFSSCNQTTIKKPNVVIIYADDIGYGDLACYGAASVKTPNTDKLASEGLKFTNAYTCAATCTPSRYGILTGHYPFRRDDTGIARGDAPMIIKKEQFTVADLMKNAGYTTAVIGKWHLGLGEGEFNSQNWNGHIQPGPNEIGFDYSYIMAATGDHTPCVFIENGKVVNLDHSDPIEVSYTKPFEGEPLGRTHPELLKMHPSHGHDMAIINGISRIGYMRGGKSALWVDENFADSITMKAVNFIEKNNPKVSGKPFFLFFGTHDIHVPRVPHPRFKGKSGMGPRGDAIVEFDWSVGLLMETLEKHGLKENTLVILTSDNGPVVDDGYHDQAVELLGNHKPWGPLRGGKYSAFEAGTRVPFIVRWPQNIKPAIINSPVSQIDLAGILSQLTEQPIPENAAPDSFYELNTWLGKSDKGREYIIQQSTGTLSIIQDGWKYIVPSKASKFNKNTNTELGHDTIPQLYNLKDKEFEEVNLAIENHEILKKLEETIQKVKTTDRTRPVTQ